MGSEMCIRDRAKAMQYSKLPFFSDPADNLPAPKARGTDLPRTYIIYHGRYDKSQENFGADGKKGVPPPPKSGLVG